MAPFGCLFGSSPAAGCENRLKICPGRLGAAPGRLGPKAANPKVAFLNQNGRPRVDFGSHFGGKIGPKIGAKIDIGIGAEKVSKMSPK